MKMMVNKEILFIYLRANFISFILSFLILYFFISQMYQHYRWLQKVCTMFTTTAAKRGIH